MSSKLDGGKGSGDEGEASDADEESKKPRKRKKRREALTAKLLMQKIKKDKGNDVDVATLIKMPEAKEERPGSYFLTIWLDAHMRLTRRLEATSEATCKPEIVYLLRSFCGLLELVIDLKLRGDSEHAQRMAHDGAVANIQEVRVHAPPRRSKRYTPGRQLLYAIIFFRWYDCAREQINEREAFKHEREVKQMVHKFGARFPSLEDQGVHKRMGTMFGLLAGEDHEDDHLDRAKEAVARRAGKG